MSKQHFPSPDPAIGVPHEDDVSRLAYRFYEEEGRPEGRAEEHWSRAQEALRGIVPPWTVESGAGDA